MPVPHHQLPLPLYCAAQVRELDARLDELRNEVTRCERGLSFKENRMQIFYILGCYLKV